LVGRIAGQVRRGQTGFVYTYAFTMIIGVVALLGLWLSL
jgi:NADH-quinone oxidoreductase subunit L